jgi:hypothetical protein
VAGLYLSITRRRQRGEPITPLLARVEREILAAQEDLAGLSQRILTAWGNDHYLPPEYAARLKAQISAPNDVV